MDAGVAFTGPASATNHGLSPGVTTTGAGNVGTLVAVHQSSVDDTGGTFGVFEMHVPERRRARSRVSDSIRLHTTGEVSWDNQTDTYETDQWANDTVTPTRSNPSGSAAASTRSPRAWTSPSATIRTG